MSSEVFLNAIWNGKIEVVKAEVEKGADVNCIDYATNGQPTALILAFKAGREEVAQYLISKGAKVNGRDGNGNTPLFSLEMCKNQGAMAKLLIENGADINARNAYGNAALKFATTEVAAVLRNAGALG